MGQTDTVSSRHGSPTEGSPIQRSREYYFAILEGGGVYHIANDGKTVCGMTLAERSNRWFKRGSENVIPPEMDLCHFCDKGFHRELALSKAHLREELASFMGCERSTSGAFSKEELAELVAASRSQGGS